MSVWIPYVYFVKNKTTKYFYYGVKYGKRNTDPNLFWKSYFTNSKSIHRLIDLYGIDDFEYKIIKRFKDALSAIAYETMLITKNIKHEKCLNMNLAGAVVDSNKIRRIRDSDGRNSYDRAAEKISKTKYADIDHTGMNVFQRSYWKAIENNPNLIKLRADRSYNTMSQIDSITGLNKWQQSGKKRAGNNNPACRPDVRRKISEANKRWISENPDQHAKNQAKSITSKQRRGPDGLTDYERHAIFMTENNPASNTVWINNGIKNVRHPDNEDIPAGFELGRLKFKHKKKQSQVTCPYCEKSGGITNMKRYHFDNCKDKK